MNMCAFGLRTAMVLFLSAGTIGSFPVAATAQTPFDIIEASVTIRVSASVTESFAEEIEVVSVRSINLTGVDRSSGIVEIDPLTSFRAGQLSAIGQPGASFRISFQPTRELVNLQGSGMIFFQYEVSGNSLDEQDTSEPFEAESPTFQFSEEGTFHIWIGGQADLRNATPGRYQGEFTIEIEYI